MESYNFQNTNLYCQPVSKCPLCNCFDINEYYIIETYKITFKVDKCEDCGFIFTNPGFTKVTIDNFYSENYYSGKSDYSYIDERVIKKYTNHVYEKRIKKINRYIKDGSFLDVGASFGGLLNMAKKYYEPFGIEISKYACEYIKNNPGINIHQGTLDDHPYGNNFFSVISMVELIEHLSDPVKALNECYKLLIENGLLLIQTANMGGLQAKILKGRYAYYMPGHLSYFTKKNLIDLLRKTGFKKIKVFHPVEFGLMPKLLKSRANFNSPLDYLKWLKITFYHCLGKVYFNDFAATSSMVIYAFK